jgi:hypothetical protein
VTGFADVADVARQSWRQDAACVGSLDEFVDVTADHAEQLVRGYCYRCTVVARCREVGDALAPHAYGTVYGGRFYAARAPESVAVLTRSTA